jgi:hypothetical protein
MSHKTTYTTVGLTDNTTPSRQLTLGSDSSTPLTSNRDLTIDVTNGDRNIILGGDIDIGGNLTTVGGNDLTVDVTNGDRTIILGGDIDIGGNFTTIGGDDVTITTSGPTNITFPVSGTIGDVFGPSTATNNSIPRFDTSTGKLIQNTTGFICDDNFNVTIGDPTTPIDRTLHLQGEQNVTLFMEADTDNLNESEHPRIIMTQDGNFVYGSVGFGGGSDNLLISTAGDGFTPDIIFQTSGSYTNPGTGTIPSPIGYSTAMTISGSTQNISINETLNVDTINEFTTNAGVTIETVHLENGIVDSGIWNASVITVPYGGTGNSSLTDNAILYGNGVAPVSATNVSANSVLITDGLSVPSLSTTLPTAVQGNITSTGTITSGTWNGTTIAVADGGTGNTSLTDNGIVYGNGTAALSVTNSSANSILVTDGAGVPSLSTTIPAAILGNITSVGTITTGVWNGTTIAVANGGTGNTSLTDNGIVYGNGTAALTVTNVAANSVLVTSGLNVPSLSATLPTAVQGNITSTGTITSGVWNGTTINVANGGTGNTSLIDNGIVYGNGVSALSVTNVAANSVLVTGGTNIPSLSSTLPNGLTINAVSSFSLSDATTSNFDLIITSNSNLPVLTADRTLTVNVNNANRIISLTGNLTLGGNLTTTPANALTFTTTGATNVTLPTSGTLGDFVGPASATDNALVRFNTATGKLGQNSVATVTDGGRLNLPVTTGADAGVISFGGIRSFHTFGSQNVFLGNHAGNFTMTGTRNVGIGTSSSAITGTLNDLTTGSRNIAIGASAGFQLITATDNIAIGDSALSNGSAGSRNVAVGSFALQLSLTNEHVAIGYQALPNANSRCVGVGYRAGRVPTSDCVYVGHNAASASSSQGDDNVIVGSGIMSIDGVIGSERNVIIGSNAVVKADNNDNNVVIGYRAGNDISASDSSVIIGAIACDNILQATQITAIGYGSMQGITNTPIESTAVGYRSLSRGPSNCTGVGYLVLGNCTGIGNVAVGDFSLLNVTTGTNNTAIGSSSGGALLTGSGNVYIGQGIGAITNESNTTKIRNIYSSLATTRIVYADSNNSIGTLSSSRRFKNNIIDIPDDTNITMFQPKQFEFNEHPGVRQYGLIAEEVHVIDPKLAIIDDGEINAVRYDQINILMLKEIIALRNEINSLKNDVEILKNP